jgi:hypothetical protein
LWNKNEQPMFRKKLMGVSLEARSREGEQERFGIGGN